MDAHTLSVLLVAGGAGFVVVWVLHKIGKALAFIVEALATVAAVFLALWLIIKTWFWLGKTVVTHWRTTLDLLVVGSWLVLWGWLSLVITVVVLAVAGWTPSNT